MQKLFISGGDSEDYIDVYYNDYYGLMKSKRTFESVFKNETLILN